MPYPELPDRVRLLLDGFSSVWQADVREVRDMALEGVQALHDPDYVSFLVDLCASLRTGEEYIPSIFHPDMSAAPVRFRGGMFCAEIGTPILADTVNVALNSAATAEAAARAALEHSRDTVAMCRPPGHHAGPRRYGGYCFFNNAYLAASLLASHGRCAVLDVDYHLGDGSAELASEGIPYFSLHADPWRNYPYLDARDYPRSPHAHLETLPSGVDGPGYLDRLRTMLERIEALNLDYLVLSLGFDTAGTDPIQDDKVGVRPEDYRAMGHMLSWLRPRVVAVLEGGYDLNALGECARHFAEGFKR